MGSGTEIEKRNLELSGPAAKLFVISEDVCVLPESHFQNGIVTMRLRLDDLTGTCKGKSDLGILVIEMLEFPYKRTGNYEPDVSENVTYRDVKVEPYFEGHQ